MVDPTSNRTLYFRGKRIVRAVLLDLLRSRGMDGGTEVVLSGCSAGGLAVYLQADYVASFLPKAARFVFEMIHFVSKVMNSVSKLIDFVLKVMDFVFKMMEFSSQGL